MEPRYLVIVTLSWLAMWALVRLVRGVLARYDQLKSPRRLGWGLVLGGLGAQALMFFVPRGVMPGVLGEVLFIAVLTTIWGSVFAGVALLEQSRRMCGRG